MNYPSRHGSIGSTSTALSAMRRVRRVRPLSEPRLEHRACVVRIAPNSDAAAHTVQAEGVEAPEVDADTFRMAQLRGPTL